MDADVDAALLKALKVQIQTVNGLVAEAQGLKEPDRRDKLAEAGRVECAALKGVLRPDGLLQRLREQLEDAQLRPIALPLAGPRVIELRRLLREPTLTDLLGELGYKPPPPAWTLTNQISRSLRQVTVAARRGTPLPTFDQAEVALAQFRDAVCDLTGITEDAQQRSEWINRGRAMLVTLLLAAVVTPGVTEAVQHVTPHAVEFVRAVADRAGDALHTLSLSAVAGASRIASDAVADSNLRGDPFRSRGARDYRDESQITAPASKNRGESEITAPASRSHKHDLNERHGPERPDQGRER